MGDRAHEAPLHGRGRGLMHQQRGIDSRPGRQAHVQPPVRVGAQAVVLRRPLLTATRLLWNTSSPGR